MTKFDYKWAKQEIAEIIAIVETCPEPLREKCFELLFAAVFEARAPVSARASAAAEASEKSSKSEAVVEQSSGAGSRKLPSNVVAFSRRHGVTPEELEKLFLLDHEPLLPIYKIPTGNAAKAQLYKAMMVLLENGLLNNQFNVPYSELRDSIKEDGLMDTNFNKMLKRNHELFRGAITEDGIREDETVELTGPGLDRLAEVVKDLNQS